MTTLGAWVNRWTTTCGCVNATNHPHDNCPWLSEALECMAAKERILILLETVEEQPAAKAEQT